MKPIEPGCLALYTGGTSENDDVVSAQSCHVVCRDHFSDEYTCTRCGKSDSWVTDIYVGRLQFISCECGLIRIDGDPDEVTEEDKREVVA